MESSFYLVYQTIQKQHTNYKNIIYTRWNQHPHALHPQYYGGQIAQDTWFN
jgi:hypothetical protein